MNFNKNKIIAFFLTIIIAFNLSGCTYSATGVDSMLAPPKLSEQQNEIYAALTTSVGKNIKLKYPRRGDFTSAFLIANIDEEKTQEAIVFYENNNNSGATMPIRINVLDQENGKWISKGEIGVEASEIDKVSFVTANQKIYIVIGFTLISKAEKSLKLYSFDGKMLNEISTTPCNNYEVFDINGDSLSEVITITQKNKKPEQKNAVATVNTVTASGLNMMSMVAMNNDVTEYVNINKGKLSDGSPALYLDGLMGTNNLSTEILTMKDNQLTNLIYKKEPEENLVLSTVRPVGSYCIDLEKDGVFEIPTVIPAPGYEDVPKHQMQSFTKWLHYENNMLKVQDTSFVSYQLGYVMTFPYTWKDKVTVEYSISDDEVVFYDYDSETKRTGARILSIMVVKKVEYDQYRKHKNYEVLKDNGQLVYLYQSYDFSKQKLTPQEIDACFRLI